MPTFTHLNSLSHQNAADTLSQTAMSASKPVKNTVLEELLRVMFYFLQDYEIENKQLRETLEEYNSEFAEVKNQGLQ